MYGTPRRHWRPAGDRPLDGAAGGCNRIGRVGRLRLRYCRPQARASRCRRHQAEHRRLTVDRRRLAPHASPIPNGLHPPRFAGPGGTGRHRRPGDVDRISSQHLIRLRRNPLSRWWGSLRLRPRAHVAVQRGLLLCDRRGADTAAAAEPAAIGMVGNRGHSAHWRSLVPRLPVERGGVDHRQVVATRRHSHSPGFHLFKRRHRGRQQCRPGQTGKSRNQGVGRFSVRTRPAVRRRRNYLPHANGVPQRPQPHCGGVAGDVGCCHYHTGSSVRQHRHRHSLTCGNPTGAERRGERGAARNPREVRLPGDDEPRDSHSDERRHRDAGVVTAEQPHWPADGDGARDA